MSELVVKVTGLPWVSPLNKGIAIRVAEDIECELDNLKRKALIPDAYKYHRKRLAILKGKLTRLFNKDTDEWLKDRVLQYGLTVESHCYRALTSEEKRGE